MNIALCSGMPRSGSTWSYNVCRLLYEVIAKEKKLPMHSPDLYAAVRGKKRQSSSALQFEYFLLNHYHKKQNDYVIYKSHGVSAYGFYFIASQHIKNICTFRDPRDSLASLLEYNRKTLSLQQTMHRLIAFLSHMEIYEQYSNTLFIRYETMLAQPQKIIASIIAFLDAAFLDTAIVDKIHQQTHYEAIKKITSALAPPPLQRIILLFNTILLIKQRSFLTTISMAVSSAAGEKTLRLKKKMLSMNNCNLGSLN